MTEVKYVLGMDIGGTKTALGIVDREGNLLESSVLESRADKGRDQLLKRIVSAAGEIITGPRYFKRILAIGAGFPGPVSPRDCTIQEAPNLPGWEGSDPCSLLAGALSIPVYVQNDANAAAMGEWLYGSGRQTRDFVYITVSTGIGGGIISGGQLLRGARGYGGEIGHMVLDPLGPACGCGRRGCLEALASGTAIARKAYWRLQKGEESLLTDICPEPENITAKEVFRAAEEDDPLCLEIMEDAAYWIALGLNNLLLVLNPEKIALGGGVGLGNSQFRESIEEKLLEMSSHGNYRAELVPASLGSSAGLVGAGALGWILHREFQPDS